MRSAKKCSTTGGNASASGGTSTLSGRAPTPASTAFGGGALTGGQIPAIAYNSQKKTWGSTPGAPAADTLDVKATNIGAVTVGVQRARVDCNVRLNVQSDGPLRVTLGDGCNKTLLFPGNRSAARCRDTKVPHASLPRRNLRRSRRGRISLKGTARDRGCGKRGKGKVVRVFVSVAKLQGHTCRFVQKNGKLARARSCRLPILLRAKGTSHWKFTLKRRLHRGRYRAWARAVDSAGNIEKPRIRRNTIRFRAR